MSTSVGEETLRKNHPTTSMRMRPIPRSVVRFLVLFLLGAALVTAGAALYVRSQVERELHALQLSELEAVRLGEQSLHFMLSEAAADVGYMASEIAQIDARAEVSEADLARLAIDFASYGLVHGGMAQVRLIGRDGRERLRMEFDGAQARRVAPAELQDKSGRDYVSRAMELPAGGIYVSRFDLNIEQGRVQVPHEPVLRLSTPAEDRHGRRLGVLVINYRGAQLLERFAQAVGRQADRVMLLNTKGYWMRSPQHQQEWGFVLDKADETLAHRDAEVWAAMSAAAQGQVETRSGLWSWATVRPMADVSDGVRHGDHVHAGGDAAALVHSSDRVWHVVLQQPAEALAGLQGGVWEKLSWWLLTPLLLVALVVTWAVRALARIETLHQQLKDRAEAAESADRSKAEFIANMSHEIRTPMHAMLGLTYLLRQKELAADAAAMVDKIGAAGRSLLAIINSILDFAKIDARRMEIEEAPFRLSDVLEHVATMMAGSAADKDLELMIVPPAEPHLDALLGDSMRIEQVLVNLTGNAIKFTDSGHVVVAVEAHEDFEDRVALRFSVSDTGVGISQSEQREIFAPFAQADASTTRRFGGTGLGLSICRRLVELMGGCIGVLSTPGQGSVFWFALTLRKAARGRGDEARVAHETATGPAHPGMKVLCAPGDPRLGDALSRTVSSLGWLARPAAGHAELMDRLASRPLDAAAELLLLDARLPRPELAELLRAAGPPGPDRRWLVLLMVRPQDRESVGAWPEVALVDAILDKPLTAARLLHAVEAARRSRNLGGRHEEREVRGQRLAGLRLMVADDSDINREVALRIFGGEGAQVHLAADGREAVRWLSAYPQGVDLVLMDVQMPEMDGLEATRRLRANPATAGLPVLALSAGAFDQQRDEASAAGMNGFIPKPIDVDFAVQLILSRVAASRATGRAPAEAPRESGYAKRAVSDGAGAPKPAPVPSAQAPHLSQPPQPAQPPRTPAIPAPGQREVPAFDLRRAMNLWGDAAVLADVLRRFAREQVGAVATLRSLESKALAASAHKLAGAAASLGLAELERAARELERGLLSGGDDESDRAAGLDRLERAQDAALRAIEAHLGGAGAADVTQGSASAPADADADTEPLPGPDRRD